MNRIDCIGVTIIMFLVAMHVLALRNETGIQEGLTLRAGAGMVSK